MCFSNDVNAKGKGARNDCWLDSNILTKAAFGLISRLELAFLDIMHGMITRRYCWLSDFKIDYMCWAKKKQIMEFWQRDN